eukprot:g1566.t1
MDDMMDATDDARRTSSISSSGSSIRHRNDYLDDIGEPHEYVQSSEEEETEDEDVRDDAVDDPPPPVRSLRRKESNTPIYGAPSLKSAESAFRNEAAFTANRTPPAGLIWHCQLYPGHFRSKKHCLPSGKLKSRRPRPQAYVADFLSSLVLTKDGRWVFSGALNGWPALTNLEVISITGKKRLRSVRRYWIKKKNDRSRPTIPPGLSSIRATLRAPSWTDIGWSRDSPGLVFWYAPHYNAADKESFATESSKETESSSSAPRFYFGTEILAAVPKSNLERNAKCVRAHHYAHRYANDHESIKDKLTYHAVVLLEWDHARFCTVVELAWRNGLGGYKGRSNWVEDKNSSRTALYDAMPAALKAPWISSRSEIRCVDMDKIKSAADFDRYLKSYTGKGKSFRFYRPERVAHGAVCLAFRSRLHIMTYLLNYIRARVEYSEFASNCQTFAADFFGFLVAEPETVPYSSVNRIGYKPSRNLFLRKKEVAFEQMYRCKSCDVMLPPDYEIDHIIPVALGGHGGFSNLQALCGPCHRRKTQSDMQCIIASKKTKSSAENVGKIPTRTKCARKDRELDSKFLNAEQQAAVMHDVGKSVRVVAGPGTGKTAVLTQRIAALVNAFGVAPRHICALTFTNRAAHEMRERIAGLLSPEDAEQVTLGTFHSVCLSILRSHIELVHVLRSVGATSDDDGGDIATERPYRRGFGVYDATDSLNVIRLIVRRELGWTAPEDPSPSSLQAAISAAKNKGMVDARTFIQQRGDDVENSRVATVFAMYEQVLRQRNQIDFDDMLWLTSTLLRQHPEVLSTYRRRWTNVLVDEFQDTNVPQFDIIRLLGSSSSSSSAEAETDDDGETCPSIFAVGDPDQSIYGFRGSQASTLTRLFDDAFEPVAMFRLRENYRSTQKILDAAYRLVRHNSEDSLRDDNETSLLRSSTSPEKTESSLVSINSFEDERDEARFIAESCLRSLLRDSNESVDIAVLMRTNAQFRCIERELIKHKIHHVVVNGTRFFDRKEVRDVVALVKTVVRPKDCLALERIINVPPRQIGAKTLLSLRNAAAATGSSMWETMSFEVDRIGKAATAFDEIIAEEEEEEEEEEETTSRLPKRSISKLATFHSLIEGARRRIFAIDAKKLPAAESDATMLSDAIVELLRHVGYDTYCREELSAGDERWSNVRELVNSAASTHVRDVSRWLDEVALLSDPTIWSPTDKKSTNEDFGAVAPPVRVMTIHASKGSEFSTVFVAGCEEELLPHYHALTSMEEKDSIEEERRCCYVALTRAKKRVYLTHTLTKKNLKKLFNYLDVDGSGDLDKDEFERAFFHLEIYIRSKDVDDLFNTYSKQESLDNPKRGINFESFRLVLREIVKRPKGSSKIARTLQKVATGAMSLIGTSPTKKSENTGIRSKGIDDDGDKKDDANARSLPSRDDLRSIFGHMDRDGSGGVDRAEMILTLRHLGMYRSEEQVDCMFEKFTGHKKSSAINFDQFCNLVLHQMKRESSTFSVEQTASFRRLGRKISLGVKRLGNVDMPRAFTNAINVSLLFVLLATIWETIFYICIYNSDFEPFPKAYGIDLAFAMLLAVRLVVWYNARTSGDSVQRLYYLTGVGKRNAKVVPSTGRPTRDNGDDNDDDVVEEEEDDDDDDDDDDDKTVSSMASGNGGKGKIIITSIPRPYVLCAIVSVVPIDLLVDILGASPWTVVLCRLNRLLRCALLFRLHSEIASYLGEHKLLPGFKARMTAYLFGALGFLAHLHGCVFYLVASVASSDPTWASVDGLWTTDPDTSDRIYLSSVAHRYARSLYWSIVTLLTVGFGDVVPLSTSKTEMLVTVWTMYTGAAISCAIVGCIVHAFSDGDATDAICRQRREGVLTYMRGRNVPMRLQRRVLEYFENLDAVMKGTESAKVEKTLPGPLRTRLMRRVASELLESVDSLRLVASTIDQSTGARRSIISGLSGFSGNNLYLAVKNEIAELLMGVREVFSPGEIVKRKGDPVTGLFVLATGVACVEDVRGSFSEGQKYIKLIRGDIIEEHLVWREIFSTRDRDENDLAAVYPLNAVSVSTLTRTVRAKTYCAFFYVSTERLKQCLAKHLWPKQMRRLREDIAVFFELKEKVRNTLLSTTEVRPVKMRVTSWLLPGSFFRDVWKIAVFVAVVVQLALFPIQLVDFFEPAWPTSSSERIAYISMLTDCLFVVDIVLNAHYFPFVNDGVLVHKKNGIWARYASEWFFPDILAATGIVRYVYLWSFDSKASVFVALSILQIFRWPRVIEYGSKASAVIQERTAFDVNVKYRRFVQMYILLLLLLHWGACLWIFVGKWSVEMFDAETNWMTTDRTDRTLDVASNTPGSLEEYLRAIYFVAVAVSTVGYGDISATNAQETWSAVLLLYVIGFVYPSLIGCIASLISSSDDARAAARHHMENATALLVATTTTSSDRVARNLRIRMTRYVDYIEKGRDTAGSETRIMDLLPVGLRNQIAVHIAKQSGNEFFRDVMDRSTMCRWMLARMRPHIYLPSDNVLVRGESFDAMLVVDTGALAMHRADTGKLVALYGVGQVYGEHALIGRQIQHDTLWSVVFSTVMELQRHDFRAVVQQFPDEGREMVKSIRRRCDSFLGVANEKALRKSSRRFQSRRSASADVVLNRMTPVERSYLESFLKIGTDRNDGANSDADVEADVGDTSNWGRSLQARIRNGDVGDNTALFGHPLSVNPLRLVWDVSVLVAILFDCVTVPLFAFVFDSDDGKAVKFFGIAVDVVYALHVLLTFCFFSVISHGLVVRERAAQVASSSSSSTAARLTFRGYRQIFAAVPWYLIVSSLTSNKFARWFSLLGKIVRFPEASVVWGRLETASAFASLSAGNVALGTKKWRKRARIVQIFSVLLLVAHYAAGALFCFAESIKDGRVDDDNALLSSSPWNGTWIAKQIENEHLSGDGGTSFERYSRALYWAVSTMVVVVIGDVTPVSISETLYVLAIVLVGVVINAAIIGNLISLSSSASDTEFLRKKELASRYMDANLFPALLRERVVHAMAHQWDTERCQRCLKQLEDDMLPKSLRLAAKSHLGGRMLLTCPVFSILVSTDADGDAIATTSATIKRLILSLDLHVMTPGDTICDAHDRATRLFLIRSGLVRIDAPVVNEYLASRKYERLPDPAMLGHGAYFGEQSLSNADERVGFSCFQSYGFSATADTFAEICVLRRTDFVKALRDDARAHVDIVCRVNAWCGWQWLEQLSPTAASVMSQSILGVDVDDDEDDDSDEGGGKTRGACRQSSSASVGCEMLVDDGSNDESKREESASMTSKQRWMYENTSVGRLVRRLSSHRVPYVTLARKLSEDAAKKSTKKRLSGSTKATGEPATVVGSDGRISSTGSESESATSTWTAPLAQQIWEVLFFVVSLYVVVATSYHASASQTTRGPALLVFDTIADIFFAVNVYLRATTLWIYCRGGVLLTQRRDIFACYSTKRECYVDFTLALPISLLYRICGGTDYSVEIFLRLPQLARIVDLRRTHTIQQLLAPVIGVANFRVLGVAMIYVLVNHLCACAWVAMRLYCLDGGDVGSGGANAVRTWSTNAEDQGAVETSHDLYFHAFYFVVTCMSTTGYGDVRPYTLWGTWFNTFVCLIGSVLFSLLIGAFQALFDELNALGVSAFDRQQDELDRYMCLHNVSDDFRRTINEHFKASYVSLGGAVAFDTEVICGLPNKLQEDIALHLYGDLLCSVSFTTFWSDSFKARFARYLRCVFFCAGDVIFSQAERGDTLYIVMSGKVNFTIRRRYKSPRAANRKKRFRRRKETFELGVGDYFGESSIVGVLDNQYGGNFRRHTAKATTACQLLYVNAETMQAITSVVPISQRTFVLQQLRLDPIERFKATGSTKWLRLCHAAYVTGAARKGPDRHILRKGTGTTLLNKMSFDRKPLVRVMSGSGGSGGRVGGGRRRRKEDQGKESRVPTIRRTYSMPEHSGQFSSGRSSSGRKSARSGRFKDRRASFSYERQRRASFSYKRQRRASFSAVYHPSAMDVRRHRQSPDDPNKSSIIARSLSFLRNKSTDLIRTISGTSASLMSTTSSVGGGSCGDSTLFSGGDYDESGGSSLQSGGGSTISGRLTPYISRLLSIGRGGGKGQHSSAGDGASREEIDDETKRGDFEASGGSTTGGSTSSKAGSYVEMGDLLKELRKSRQEIKSLKRELSRSQSTEIAVPTTKVPSSRGA